MIPAECHSFSAAPDRPLLDGERLAASSQESVHLPAFGGAVDRRRIVRPIDRSAMRKVELVPSLVSPRTGAFKNANGPAPSGRTVSGALIGSCS